MGRFRLAIPMTNLSIWQLFHDFIQAAQELELDEALLTEVEEKFDMLNPLQITNLVESGSGMRRKSIIFKMRKWRPSIGTLPT